jgi:putative tryptophan/tyrosine transport system substrate-binding protein
MPITAYSGVRRIALDVRRRSLLAMIGSSTLAWPLRSYAQQRDQPRRISVLQSFDAIDPEAQRRIRAFRQGLQDLGWIEGQNLRVDYRWGGANPERIRSFAAELVRTRPDVILASTTLVLQLLQRETQTIPIVFTQLSDPIGDGIVANLVHPGGNITGLTSAEQPVLARRSLELLLELPARIGRVTVLINPDQPSHLARWHVIERSAAPLGVQVKAAEVRRAAEITPALEGAAREPNPGLVVLPDALTTVYRTLIIGLAARHRLPTIYPYRFNVVSGGLMSYGADSTDQYRRAALYVDHILRGAKPGDLPIEEPTRLELVINMKTAKALGLDIPPALRRRADEVIE